MAQIGREANQKSSISTYHYKVDVKPVLIPREEKQYKHLPKYYDFGSWENKEEVQRNNMKRIKLEVANIISSF